MKPIFAKENGRWSDKYSSEKYQDIHYAGFIVKFDDSEKLQNLIIKTNEDRSVALSYSIDGGSDVTGDELSWANALLQTANKNAYCAAQPKEFELHTEGSNSHYALTKASKAQMDKHDRETYAYFSRHSFTGTIGIILSNTDAGPEFRNTDTHTKFESSI